MIATLKKIVHLNDAIQARIDNPDCEIDIKALADDLLASVETLQSDQKESLKEHLFGTLALLKAMENQLLNEQDRIRKSLQDLSTHKDLAKAYTRHQEEEA